MSTLALLGLIGGLHAQEAVAPAASAQSGDRDVGMSSMPAPAYPELAALMRIAGRTVLIVDVSPQGEATDVVVEKSSRNRDLDRAAIDAARRWKFVPALKAGEPVAGRVRVPVDFAQPPLTEAKLADLIAFWSGRLIPRDGPDKEARILAFSEEPSPLGKMPFAALLAQVEASTRLQVDGSDVRVFRDETAAVPIYWLHLEDEAVYAPSLLRFRWVSEAGHSYWMIDTHCGAAQIDCDNLQVFLRDNVMARQLVVRPADANGLPLR